MNTPRAFAFAFEPDGGGERKCARKSRWPAQRVPRGNGRWDRRDGKREAEAEIAGGNGLVTRGGAVRPYNLYVYTGIHGHDGVRWNLSRVAMEVRSIFVFVYVRCVNYSGRNSK